MSARNPWELQKQVEKEDCVFEKLILGRPYFRFSVSSWAWSAFNKAFAIEMSCADEVVVTSKATGLLGRQYGTQISTGHELVSSRGFFL